MSVQVHNQKPGLLDPVYTPPYRGDYNVNTYMTDVFSPLFRNALVPSTPVTVDIDGATASDDDINNLLLECCNGTVNTAAEDNCRELFTQTLQHYNPNTKLLLKDVFAVSSGAAAGLDEPDPVTIYTPAVDVIPVSSRFLAGTADYDEYFATMAFYCRFEAFGAYFVNDTAFADFKTWFQNAVSAIQNNLSCECLSLINDFMKLDLSGLSESFKIRNNETENLEEYSFARILISHLMTYFGNTTRLAGIMPFDFENLFCPVNVVFINVERYAHASPAAVTNDVKDINDSINIMSKVRMISNSKLTKLAPVAKQLRKTQSMAIQATLNNNTNANRMKRVQFKKQIMTRNEYLVAINKVLKRMKTERITQNVYKMSKLSFAKPNRRNPDDFNLQGKIVSTKYRPDIHIYLDTSGSISEENYEASIKLAIQLAKKLDVNLYFNTFSHIISQTTLLKCAGKSVSQIYNEFQKTPKVTGGTDFEQIWHFINKSKKRELELSIMITDFEWSARSAFIKHPKNLYYMPCANIPWNYICQAAKDFIKSCEHNDPYIRTHILM